MFFFFVIYFLFFFFFFFFFFMQKTAYEIRLSLVGSEMCIRDRCGDHPGCRLSAVDVSAHYVPRPYEQEMAELQRPQSARDRDSGSVGDYGHLDWRMAGALPEHAPRAGGEHHRSSAALYGSTGFGLPHGEYVLGRILDA